MILWRDASGRVWNLSYLCSISPIREDVQNNDKKRYLFCIAFIGSEYGYLRYDTKEAAETDYKSLMKALKVLPSERSHCENPL